VASANYLTPARGELKSRFEVPAAGLGVDLRNSAALVAPGAEAELNSHASLFAGQRYQRTVWAEFCVTPLRRK
jgi:hypothetical protein